MSAVMRGSAVEWAFLRCPTHPETNASLIGNRDLRALYRTARPVRLASPLFGIIAIALMLITGGSVWRQRAWLSPLALFASGGPEGVSVQDPNPAEGPAVVLTPVTPMALEPTPTVAPLDEGPEEATPTLLAPSGPSPVAPTVAPTGAPTQEPELPQSTATQMLEPTVAATLESTLELMATATLEPIATATPEPTLGPVNQPDPDPSLAQPPAASSAPVRIVAPAIDLDQPVVTVGWHQETVNNKLVSVWDVAQYAVGWHKNSQLPGQGGNIVLAGHNNIYGEVFKRLEDLKSGDLITVYADDRAYDYAVESTVIVKEEGATPEEKAANVRWIGSFPDERLTLVACYPYTGNSHRILIIARPRFEVS
jgi:sortase A